MSDDAREPDLLRPGAQHVDPARGELTSGHAAIGVLALIGALLVGAAGAFLGVIRVGVELHRSCPTSPLEEADAALATVLGECGALAFIIVGPIASVGVVQALRRQRASRWWSLAAVIVALLGLALGLGAASVPHTTMC